MANSLSLRRVVLFSIAASVALRACRVHASNWTYDFDKELTKDETKTEIIEPGDTVSVTNSGKRQLTYNPTDAAQVLVVGTDDTCNTGQTTALATLFPATGQTLTWKQTTDNGRTLTIPVGSVAKEETRRFCFQVIDSNKKTLTAIIKVASARGLSVTTAVFLGLPGLAFALTSI